MIKELTAAGQLGIFTSFPFNRCYANLILLQRYDKKSKPYLPIMVFLLPFALFNVKRVGGIDFSDPIYPSCLNVDVSSHA